MTGKHNKSTMESAGGVDESTLIGGSNAEISSSAEISDNPRLTDQGGADRINNISFWLKQRFGRKMIKLSIDGGFTCPNRDGSKGTGGCLFCGEGAGGDFASDIDSQIRLYQTKWPDAGYIAYFQNHTNTYAPVDVLRCKFYSALDDPRISGIAIATRPDCLGLDEAAAGIAADDYDVAGQAADHAAGRSSDVLDLLTEINDKHFMWVELGLQTSNDKTADLINRCYPTSVYDDAMDALNARGIKTVTHLILGLPGESEEDMRRSVEHAIKKNTWGIKLHMLNVVRGSRLADEMPDYVPFESMEQYIDLVCDLIEIIPFGITIHRLTADAPRSTLIAPEWSYMKRSILNGIHAELRRRGTYQGSRNSK